LGVPKKLWDKLKPAGQVAMKRMYSSLGDDPAIWTATGSSMGKREWSVLRYNVSLEAGFVAKEMQEDVDGGIAEWVRP